MKTLPKLSEYVLKVVQAPNINEAICLEQIDEIIDDSKEQTWSRWCNLCEMMSTFSDSNPYGTCQCN